jgi:Outer membrane protein beta-barrel domain
MPSRYRRLVLPVFIVLALVVAPTLASAQTQDESVPQVGTPATNLLRGISFLPASPSTVDDSEQAQPQSRSSGHPHEGFGVGVKIGPLFSTLSGGNVTYSNRTGLIGGLWFGGNRGGIVGVMGEVLYAKKNGGSAAQTVDLYYLEIPILLRVNIGSSSVNGANFYVLAGPAADVLLKGKQGNLDVKSNYSGLDIGVKFGAGFEIMRLLVELQENIGLRSVLSGTGVNDTKIHSRAFAIMVGVRFN